jgi:hypothetical protein
MNEETPPDLDLAGEWDAELESRTVKDRVYEVATTLTSPTAVAEIADRADCTKEGARPYLQWFVELGVLEKVTDNPALFVRNEAYFEFRRVTELTREFETADAITDAIDIYREREGELAAQFEAPSPDAVVIADVESGDLNDAYDTLSEWRAVTRRLRELHEAKRRLESGSNPASASPLP